MCTSTQKGGEEAVFNLECPDTDEEDVDGLGEVPFRGFDLEETQRKSTAASSAPDMTTPRVRHEQKLPPIAMFKELKEKHDMSGSLSDKSEGPNLRFGEPTSASQLEELSVKQFAETTDKKITWAINLFHEWRMNRLRVGPFDHTHGTLQWVNVNDSGNLLKPHLSFGIVFSK